MFLRAHGSFRLLLYDCRSMYGKIHKYSICGRPTDFHQYKLYDKIQFTLTYENITANIFVECTKIGSDHNSMVFDSLQVYLLVSTRQTNSTLQSINNSQKVLCQFLFTCNGVEVDESVCCLQFLYTLSFKIKAKSIVSYHFLLLRELTVH